MEIFSKEAIFWLFCMGVPVFMAYNGGATAATVDTIQQAGGWTPTGIGLLGAMDKIGMTLSAGVWGWVLQKVPCKVLLSAGLLVNTISVAIFAVTQNIYLMYATKMLIGLTEGLQWVWAPLWVAKWADEASLPLWINLSGCVSAGVGNGVGTLLAGFSTAHGLPYATAFQFEAAVLGLLLAVILFVPAGALKISSAVEREKVKEEILDSDRRIRSMSDDISNLEGAKVTRPRVRSGSFLHPVVPTKDMSVGQQVQELWQNKLFCRATMAFASANYINAGLAFLWIRLFMALWGMEKQLAVVSFLVITGVGGAIGISISSSVKEGSNAQVTLGFLQKALYVSCLGAAMMVAGLLLQLLCGRDYFYLFLTLAWSGVILLCTGIGSTTGLIQIVCNNSVEEEELRSFGVGLAQGTNNLFGMSFGPLLPQMVMDLLTVSFALSPDQALFAGAVSVAAVTFAVLGCVTAALEILPAQCATPKAGEQALPSIVEDAADQPLIHSWCCNYEPVPTSA
ncbi:unnamed protein product [Effrenium voratum]|nr:unnamed protein product [Effrenium voratum]